MGREASRVLAVVLTIYVSLCQCSAEETPSADDLDTRCDRWLQVTEQKPVAGELPAVCQISEWGDPIPAGVVNPSEKTTLAADERLLPIGSVVETLWLQGVVSMLAGDEDFGWAHEVFEASRSSRDP